MENKHWWEKIPDGGVYEDGKLKTSYEFHIGAGGDPEVFQAWSKSKS
jgi:hypothetical protein